MAETSLAKKLGIKPNYEVLILNAPDGYLTMLDPLPEGVTIKQSTDGTFDVVQLFAQNQASLKQDAEAAIKAIKPGGWLWLSYPKKSSKIKTDISRDAGWDAIISKGFTGVSLIAVDDTWSAMRFRPNGDIKSLNK